MPFISAPDFKIRSVTWTLEARATINVSAYTGQRTVAANPWHSRWRAQVELALIQGEDDFSELRSFFARCRGSINTFRLYATTAPQNSDIGVTVSVAAPAGATALSIAGYTTPLNAGEFFTVNGQLCCCTDDQVGSDLRFEPPLREAAAVGTYVETSEPFAIVYMSSPQIAWNIEPWRLFSTSFDVEEAILEKPALFFDTFTDPLSTNIRLRGNVQSSLVYGYQSAPAKWRIFAGVWGADGDGYVSATVGSNMLLAALLAPAGTAGDRKITTVIKSSFNFRPGTVIATDGRYALFWEFGGIGGNTLRIRQGDMHQFSPTYRTASGNAFTTLATSANIATYVAAVDNTFVATLTGVGSSPVLTLTHVESGISVSTTPGQITVPIGPEFGITSTNVAAKIKSVKAEAIGATTLFDIGNGVSLVNMRTLQWAGDVDGVSLADRNSDGLPDLIYGVSGNGNGVIGGVYTATQGPKDTWRTAPALTNSTISVTDKWNGIEGVCLVPIDNYRYAFVNDTPTQGQWLLDLNTGNRLQLSTNVAGQDCRILTIAGEKIIVATYEGGTAVSGGVVGYRYLGDDPLTLANWQIFPIVIRPGAWAFQKSNFGFVDLNNDGGQWLVYGARDSANAFVTAPGFYAVPLPVNPFAGSWAGEVALYAAPDGTDVINWDFGDFSGDGNGLDIVFATLNQQAAPKYLRKSTGWTVTNTVTIGLSATQRLWNVGKMPTRGTGTRDGFWAWVGFQGYYHVYWNGSAWVAKLFHGDDFDHGTNAPSQPTWDRGDGSHSIFLGNSFSNDLLEMRVK